MYSVRMGDIFWNSVMLTISFCIVYFTVWLIEIGFQLYISSFFRDIPYIETINCFLAMIGACAVLISSTTICVNLPSTERYDGNKKKEEKKRVQSRIDSF